MENNITHYANSPFEQPWWLDVVAPNAWEEILIEEDGEVIARWPLVKKGFGFGMPILTTSLGFWISGKILDSDSHYDKRKKVINQLLEKLPGHKSINVMLNPKVDYFLPMLWKHFIVSPRVVYRINDLTNLDEVYNRFNNIVKKNLRTAVHKVSIKEVDDIEILLTIMDKTFSLQKRKSPFPKELVRNIYKVCKEHNACRLLYAIDKDGIAYSGLLFVYDSHACYALIGGSDPAYRSSGANTLLIWEGIKFAATVSKSFDFQGSTIEGIESFLRQFGGSPMLYYHVRKQNLVLEMMELMKPRIKTLLGYKQ